jgi:hypothetical protein
MKRKSIFKMSICIAIVLSIVYFSTWNSVLNKSTRYLDNKLSYSIPQISGTAEDLFDIDYDTLYVFEPYQTKDEMEAQIGFKCRVLNQVVSEGILNILFVKDNSPVAYLYGYPSTIGYFIGLPTGKHTKAELDLIQYNGIESQVGNSAGPPKTYMRYTFDM